MTERDKELLKQADKFANENRTQNISAPGNNYFELLHEKFADLIRADEREAFVAFIQSYPHWLGNKAKEEIVQAIKARGNI
jgi:hypothetical protein